MLIDIIIAFILDIILGDPYCFPHPVKLMGKIISLEDRLFRSIFYNRTGLKFAGFVIVVLNISIGFCVPLFLLKIIRPYPILYRTANIYLIYTCISARCLHYEAMRVYKSLGKGIKQARHRLSYIVGRETKNLSREEIIKATVETVAENTSDGVVAPLIYIFLLGAPGGMAYKFINTMDSMLGYMNEKYIDIGYFPAKTDDIFNFIPARLTGILMSLSCLGRFNIKSGIKIMIRNRKNHKSPNAAFPEGAVAGLLGIRLGGNNIYNGKLVEKPTIGNNINMVNKNHIKNTIEIMYRSEVLLLTIYILIQWLNNKYSAN